MPSADELINLAQSQVGYVETPNNITKYGAWYGLDGEPWCAMFVSWCFAQIGMTLGPHPKGFAYCPDGINWFKSRMQWYSYPQHAQPGDVVFYEFVPGTPSDHCGIVKQVGSAGLLTIEGNTSDANPTDGGAVQNKSRPYGSYILGYGRPLYIESNPAPYPVGDNVNEQDITITLDENGNGYKDVPYRPVGLILNGSDPNPNDPGSPGVYPPHVDLSMLLVNGVFRIDAVGGIPHTSIGVHVFSVS